MTYDKATDPDAGLRLDFTSRKRDGFISSTDDSMRHEMQRMVDKINQLEKRIIELEKKRLDFTINVCDHVYLINEKRTIL